MNIRPRRNRKNKAVRAFAQETHLGVENLIYPIFVYDGKGIKNEVKSLPGNYRWSLDMLLPEIESCLKLGISTYVLFPAVEENLKDKIATYSYAEENFYLHVLRKLKETFPEICLMTDVAMDPYSSDGHDGYVNEKEKL
jgi:porphobilinogen synthase